MGGCLMRLRCTGGFGGVRREALLPGHYLAGEGEVMVLLDELAMWGGGENGSK